MHRVLAIFAVLAGISWCAGLQAQVYRCVAANGSVSFPDHTCAAGQRQTIINVPSRAPPGYAPPPVATVAPPSTVAADTALPPVPVPPAPLPELYACVGAVNGKPYVVRTPTPPYLVPLGVLGYPPQSLSQVYGAPGGAGMSAPEFAQPRIGGPRIGTGLTEVQDYCLPATHAQVCDFVQKEYGANHRQLRMAMRHEQPPLEQRERQLQDQLRNCR
jgi:hypothetical protein